VSESSKKQIKKFLVQKFIAFLQLFNLVKNCQNRFSFFKMETGNIISGEKSFSKVSGRIHNTCSFAQIKKESFVQ
jgi:hypothetical protein